MKHTPLDDSVFQVLIHHPAIDDIVAAIMHGVRNPSSTKIYIVAGAAGSGKSTARQELARRIQQEFGDEFAQHPERIPVAAYTVKEPGPTAFSWKDTYIQALKALAHPFADSPATLLRNHPAKECDLAPLTAGQAQRTSNDRLFRIVQDTIQRRKPKAILVDEAHHLLAVSSDKALTRQLEHLKYLADESDTIHVLFGTYELLRVADFSAALVRRRQLLHFSRYVYNPAEGASSLVDFAKVAKQFESGLGNRWQIETLSEIPYLYQGCVGCIGVLRDWLFRASHRSKEGLVTKKTLAETELPPRDRLTLLKQAQTGEKYFVRGAEEQDEFFRLLGFASAAEPTEKKPAQELKPGQRKPHRDPTGPDSIDTGSPVPA